MEINWPEILTPIGILVILLTAFYQWVFSQTGKRILEYVKDLRSSKDLHPFFKKKEVLEYSSNFIETKFSESPPSDYENLQKAMGDLLPTQGIKWMIEYGLQDDIPTQYYLILADAGMGKTAFMVNLYLRYKRNIRREFDIKLFPISHESTSDEIKNIVEKGDDKKTILLLDAFDEDREASENWGLRFQQIVDLSITFRKVVITSRTQFFPDNFSEPSQFNLNIDLYKFYVLPFSNPEVDLFLKRKFKRLLVFPNRRKIRESKEVLAKAKDLKVRPMILSYIQDLIDSDISFKYTFQVYEELIFKWISRETERIQDVSIREEFRENLHLFSNKVAQKIFQEWRNGRKGLILFKNEIMDLSREHDINLSEVEMTSKSLLNRNSSGKHKFSHKSIFEFFLAKEYMINEEFKSIILGLDERVFDQARMFIAELSEDQIVHKFIHEQNIKYETKLHVNRYNLPEKCKTTFMHGHLKTMTLSEKQFRNLLIRIDDATFRNGLNNLNVRVLILLTDSTEYKIENITRFWTIRRITLYNGTKRLKDGKLIELENLLPNIYIGGFDLFKNSNKLNILLN